MILLLQYNLLASIDEQLLQAARDSNIPMVEHFMKEIKPFLTRNIRPLLTSCLLIIIEQVLIQFPIDTKGKRRTIAFVLEKRSSS